MTDPPEEEQTEEARPPAVPPDSELVFGLVGAVGVQLDGVAADLRGQLADFGYRAFDLHLTDAFDAFEWPEPLVKEPYDERVWSYMTAGNTLRDRWKRRDAMALLAINRIALRRKKLTGDERFPGDRVAYILRSLKRPEEVRFLREVYGSRFLLIGVAAPEKDRIEYLERKIRESRVPPHPRPPVHPPENLIERDEREEVPHGQYVRDTFHRADCFVNLGDGLREQIRRILDVWFGDPVRSPNRDEFGLFQAVAAARRSAEMGRQVGAAVCTSDGDVVAVGVNEVPKPGGGLYWEGDPGDAREVVRGADTSRQQRHEMAKEIAGRLAPLLKADIDPDQVLSRIEASAFGDILEFVRAVHAEMAALIDAARRGVSIAGGTLFVTTFPCHHCARHIVAAGIARVVYVAPYAKSRAIDLHNDSIVLGEKSSAGDRRIPFTPFVGIGPNRYLRWFDYGERKTQDGKLRDYDRLTAQARLTDRDPTELRSDRAIRLGRQKRVKGNVRRRSSSVSDHSGSVTTVPSARCSWPSPTRGATGQRQLLEGLAPAVYPHALDPCPQGARWGHQRGSQLRRVLGLSAGRVGRGVHELLAPAAIALSVPGRAASGHASCADQRPTSAALLSNALAVPRIDRSAPASR